MPSTLKLKGRKDKMIVALIGNQNCGKTTLFNQMTGSNQHVGNFPGVTVDRKEGLVTRRRRVQSMHGKGPNRTEKSGKPLVNTPHEAILSHHQSITAIDLPGIYSLSPYSGEELLTRNYLIEERPDVIINIVDAGNIERNLYLSLQLLTMNIPMVIALNMMDEVRANGGSILTDKMADSLGLPVVPISAGKNEGIDELLDEVVRVAVARRKPKLIDFCGGAVHRTIHSVAHLIEDHAERIRVSPRFAAVKIVEGDPPLLNKLQLSENEIETLDHMIKEMETEVDLDRKAAIADMRYSFIEDVVKKTVRKPAESLQHKRSVSIDRLLTHRIFAIPVFLLIMAFVFYLTFGLLGPALSDVLGTFFMYLTDKTRQGLIDTGFNPVLISLVCDGIFAGVGSVLSFLPTIVVLFLFLSILEDSGYMARVAFVMDRILRKIGLSGRSFVPMLIGFGCTVPAVMSARTLPGERDRKMTIFLIPFISCSAKLPIYGIFTMSFFPNHSAIVMIGLYLGGIAMALIAGLIMKKTSFHGLSSPFVMELPNYRLPSAKSVILLLYDKAKDFATKAFTIIFVASIIVWILTTFDFRMNVVMDSSNGMLAQIGQWVAPAFAPLGFGDWRAVTALITGFVAKEAVVSTLTVLTGASVDSLPQALSTIFTPASAAAFLAFSLLYSPCVAAIAAISREMKSKKAAFGIVLIQTGIAWLTAFVVYQIAFLFAR